MLSSNQQTVSAPGPIGDTRGAPKALEVFTIGTGDLSAPLQAAQLLQCSGADPILWTGTELTRSTSAGSFRLYKDASGNFGIWVPNSQAFYSNGIPPNILAPDTSSGQAFGGSRRDGTEPVRRNQGYRRGSDYRRADRVLNNSGQQRRQIRAAPYDRPVECKITTDHNRQQHHYSVVAQKRCDKNDDPASLSRPTAGSRYTTDTRRGREQSSTTATPQQSVSSVPSTSKRVRPTSSSTAVTPVDDQTPGRTPQNGDNRYGKSGRRLETSRQKRTASTACQ
ncbi:unnamed protein product [Didymodactylos carnosus]|uniref:Uncharacterized protein n=1 Tax=Didymodactylos carnosus TaxID=1234261 RepID=A0A816DPD9_9BILA|nr:unnamed protein product [Didymodactylos carnosus]CAF4547267.1 unnamed protein product [Didymodactylos carnosus]